MVKKLREQTGAGMMDCKKALTETDGDFEKAITLLREKGIAVAAKREAKSATEGLIGSFITTTRRPAYWWKSTARPLSLPRPRVRGALPRALRIKSARSRGACVNCLLEQPFRDGQTVRERLSELMGKSARRWP